MSVSTGLPRAKGIMGLTRIIRARVSATTVDRVTTSKGSLDQNTESTTGHSEDIWLFEPRENVAQEIAGERIEGGLGGLLVAGDSVDLQHGDRVTHGGVVYEIDTITGHPEDDEPDGTPSPDTDFWLVSFTRRE